MDQRYAEQSASFSICCVDELPCAYGAFRSLQAISEPAALGAAIRSHLPADVTVFGAPRKVANSFNAKNAASARRYEYILPTYVFAPTPIPSRPSDAAASDPAAPLMPPPPAFGEDDDDMGGEDDCGDDAVPRIGNKRKVEPGWEDVTQEQRKSSMLSNPPPFEHRWTDATKAAVNAALAAYAGSHMCAVPCGALVYRAAVLSLLPSTSLTRCRYHNFTSGKTHSDASSLRFIESFKVRR